MKQYRGFEAKKRARKETLPAGGYAARVVQAREEHYDWGDVLVLAFDIEEGPYAHFFARDFQQNTREDRKWRGTYRLYVPSGDGSERDEWSRNAFNNAVWVLQESNPGYTWDWKAAEKEDYSSLKGKLMGVLFRNREWEFDGKTGWTTECCALVSYQDIRNGRFDIPADKPLKEGRVGGQAPAHSKEDYEILDDLTDDDLPF